MNNERDAAESVEAEAQQASGEVVGAGQSGQEQVEAAGNGQAGRQQGQQAETPAQPADGATEGGSEGEGKNAKHDHRTPENAEAARKRREAETERKIKEATTKAVIEALGGVNPFTQKPMKDAQDVEQFRTQQRLKAEGKDPVADYPDAVAEQQRQAASAEAERARADEWVRQDREDFMAKNPGIDLNALVSNQSFRRFAEGKLGVKPLSDIYADYNALVAEIGGAAREEVKAAAAQAIANGKASAGSQNGKTAQETFYTREQVKAMTPDEIHEHYEDIVKSQKKW